MSAPHARNNWLKSIGSANDQMHEDYLTAPWGKGGRLDLVEEIRFAEHKRPSGMNAGDRMCSMPRGMSGSSVSLRSVTARYTSTSWRARNSGRGLCESTCPCLSGTSASHRRCHR